MTDRFDSFTEDEEDFEGFDDADNNIAAADTLNPTELDEVQAQIYDSLMLRLMSEAKPGTYAFKRILNEDEVGFIPTGSEISIEGGCMTVQVFDFKNPRHRRILITSKMEGNN